MNVIQERIRQRLDELGLSCTQVGYMMNLSARAVQDWKYGKNIPRSGDIPRLCEVLKCSPNYLFGWEGNDGKGNGIDF